MDSDTCLIRIYWRIDGNFVSLPLSLKKNHMLTLAIIAITALISIAAFSNGDYGRKLIFYPPAVRDGQWYRLLTYGVLHADFMHLFFNMFTFYLFGSEIERVFTSVLGTRTGSACYLLLYVSALAVAILPTYFKHRNDTFYRGLGASGAVSAVVFAYVLINPMSFMGIMFIPVMLPAFLFGFVFIALSVYLDKKQVGGINHSAHVSGGIYGVVFMIISFATLAHINLIGTFMHRINVQSVHNLIQIGF